VYRRDSRAERLAIRYEDAIFPMGYDRRRSLDIIGEYWQSTSQSLYIYESERISE
jgi:hypothetical protein